MDRRKKTETKRGRIQYWAPLTVNLQGGRSLKNWLLTKKTAHTPLQYNAEHSPLSATPTTLVAVGRDSISWGVLEIPNRCSVGGVLCWLLFVGALPSLQNIFVLDRPPIFLASCNSAGHFLGLGSWMNWALGYINIKLWRSYFNTLEEKRVRLLSVAIQGYLTWS